MILCFRAGTFTVVKADQTIGQRLGRLRARPGNDESLEVRNIQAAVKRTNGKIYGENGAAALLAMKPTTLVSRLKALGMSAIQ